MRKFKIGVEIYRGNGGKGVDIIEKEVWCIMLWILGMIRIKKKKGVKDV